MKYLVLLFFFSYVNGQIPRLKFDKETDAHSLYEMLQVENKDAVIAKISLGGGRVALNENYFVFMPNGQIYSNIVINKLGNLIVIKNEVINVQEKLVLLEAAENLNNVDNQLTNVKTKKDGQSFDIQDGGKIIIEVFQQDKTIKFYSDAPLYFIDAKVTGFEMRQKLYEIFKAFDSTKYIEAPSLDKVEDWEIVYVYFEENFLQEKWVTPKNIKYKFVLPHITIGLDVVDTDGRKKKISINNDIDNKCIDYMFFIKHGEKAVEVLRNKIVYLINKNDIKNYKTYLQKVNIYYTFW